MSFPEENLWDLINVGWGHMSPKQRFLWEVIKVAPEEWELKGYEPVWVVGIIGQSVIYYNHFEGGFNRSRWATFGMVDHYQALQHGLEYAIQEQLDVISSGYDAAPWANGPFPGEYSAS